MSQERDVCTLWSPHTRESRPHSPEPTHERETPAHSRAHAQRGSPHTPRDTPARSGAHAHLERHPHTAMKTLHGATNSRHSHKLINTLLQNWMIWFLLLLNCRHFYIFHILSPYKIYDLQISSLIPYTTFLLCWLCLLMYNKSERLM